MSAAITTRANETWGLPPSDWRLSPGILHVWRVELGDPAASATDWRALLSPEERERADAFRPAEVRRRFLVSHGVLRQALGLYLGRPASAIEFAYGAHGKPRLARMPEPGGPRFNMSHAGELALMAFALEGELGVDVEWIRARANADAIARRFFSEREQGWLRRQPEASRTGAFFELWTRKEAVLKASGEGLSGGLMQTDVLPEEPESAGRPWWLATLQPAAGYVGAIAARQGPRELRCWRWPALGPTNTP